MNELKQVIVFRDKNGRLWESLESYLIEKVATELTDKFGMYYAINRTKLRQLRPSTLNAIASDLGISY